MSAAPPGKSFVIEAQELLQAGGFAVAVDGIAGPELTRALTAFQHSTGLEPSGTIDDATLSELRARFGSGSAPSDADLSASMRNLHRELGANPATAWQILEALLRSHPHYLDGRGERLLALEPAGGEARPLDEWMAAIRPLYRPQAQGQLDGRKVIAALAILDHGLRDRLLTEDLLTQLELEIDEFGEQLSELGNAHRLADNAPTVSDREAHEDGLRRVPFVRLLAWQLRDEYERTMHSKEGPDSFMIHLDGPWGSGKSTLLNLLERELLAQQPPWLVARFNAWRHQRVGPPWWLLVKVVYREALRAEGISWRQRAGLWTENLWWRLRLARNAAAAVALAAGVIILLSLTNNLSSNDPVGVVVGSVSAITGLILSLKGFTSAFAVGSARGADTFINATRDPMNVLRRRYQALAHRITQRIGRPLVVFVDDLDRCRSDYVVDLLEGIQTTLRQAPVAYVVAGDRRWFYDSYREIYEGHESSDVDPGRPLGHLFLEKSFQLSATVPPLGPTQRSTFLRGLVKREQGATARSTNASARTVAGNDERLESEELKRREQAVERLASPVGTVEVEHYLSRFAHLLEPNPRAIKRLLNAYRPAYAVEILEGRASPDHHAKDQFVLWLILTLRWPLLADYLGERPQAADELLGSDDDVPAAIAGDGRAYLARLARDPAVRRVLRGEGVGTALDTNAIRRLLAEHSLPLS
jgi:KAP family P-loop domain/Putative peptidoglycan binding domain